MKKILPLLLCCLYLSAIAQNRRTENLIIITLDGMRWQEVFKGIDKGLMNDKSFTKDRKGLKEDFWADDENERREKLFPFLWDTIAKQGQLYGNRVYKDNLDNANPYWFSYPGYNELFTGYPDKSVNSNDKILNKNENVLEFINKQKGFNNKVAAFTSWDVFPYILNAPRSGLLINSDTDTLNQPTANFKLINDIQSLAARPLGLRPDVFTYITAREYLKNYTPKVLYIAFDETDDFAHEGLYDQYIRSAHAADVMISDLWKTVQAMPAYRGKTTILITCDHGRGDTRKASWRNHGSEVKDAHQLWLAVLGPDTEMEGEMKTGVQLYQEQIAATLAQLLGLHFTSEHPVAPPIQSILPRNPLKDYISLSW